MTESPAIGGDIVRIHGHRVACEGVGGALGHPRVWLEIGASGSVGCLYCDRTFQHVADTVAIDTLPVGVKVASDAH
jgi:uncharacterized Zn-finger protein